MTISSREALPALSPIPLMVHSTCLAPARIAAMLLATPKPRSLWQWTLTIALSMLGTLLKTPGDELVELLAGWYSRRCRVC